MTGALAADLLLAPALEVQSLRVEFGGGDTRVCAVEDASLTVNGGELVAVVGESGSGKSILLQALLGLVRGTPGVVSGQVILRFRNGEEHRPYQDIERYVRRRPGGRVGNEVVVARRWPGLVERRLRPVRGRRVGLVLQSGRAALDPFYTVGHQVAAVVDDDRPAAKAEHWFERLGFEDPKRVMKLYPHELSGGMAQRAMLGVVLAQEPELLLLDEITTGLDVSLQAGVLDLLGRLYQDVGFSGLLVTHDLGVARSLSSRVVIMRRGRVEQEAGTDDLFGRRVALTPYTDQLLQLGWGDVRPHRAPEPEPSANPPLRGTPRVTATLVKKAFGGEGWLSPPRRTVLSDVTMTVEVGQCLALVGESGSGKTTLTRILAGLTRPDGGRVLLNGRTLGTLDGPAARKLRSRRTVLFQNPYTSLNPAMTACAVVAESLVQNYGLSWADAEPEAVRRLGLLGLDHRADRVLRALSGGERRRVGLIAALQAAGDVLVLDEPTAGLDAAHRVGVRRLIESARKHQPHRTILLVSHDIGFVVQTADRVVVLYRGRVVEDAASDEFADPDLRHHPYTQLLWDASRYVGGHQTSRPLAAGHLDPVEPSRSPKSNGTAVLGRAAELEDTGRACGDGCIFRARCPIYCEDAVRWSICAARAPELLGAPARGRIACHGVRDADL